MKSVENGTGVELVILGQTVHFDRNPIVKPRKERKAKAKTQTKAALPVVCTPSAGLAVVNAKLQEAAKVDTVEKVVSTILAYVLYIGKLSGKLRMYGVCWIGDEKVGLRALVDNGGDNVIPSLSFTGKAFFVKISELFADLTQVAKNDNMPLCDVVARYRALATTPMQAREPEKPIKRDR
jgi:hypothetical protein